MAYFDTDKFFNNDQQIKEKDNGIEGIQYSTKNLKKSSKIEKLNNNDINYWIPPEILKAKMNIKKNIEIKDNKTNTISDHDKKSDIWAIGCFVLEMASKASPWPEKLKSTFSLIRAIGKKTGN